MPHNPADDIPAPSVQDDPLRHTGATCPTDGTLVVCSGLKTDPWLSGTCPVCKREVRANPELVSQRGLRPEGTE